MKTIDRKHKTFELNENIIGKKFYITYKQRIMAIKVTLITCTYSSNCAEYHASYTPIFHITTAEGKEAQLKLNWEGKIGNYYFYETPDDAMDDIPIAFTYPTFANIAQDYNLGNTSPLLDEDNYCQELTRYKWNGARPTETKCWLYLEEINKEGFILSVADKKETFSRFLNIEKENVSIMTHTSLCDKQFATAEKWFNWWNNTYPTKLDCINANKIEVVDF